MRYMGNGPKFIKIGQRVIYNWDDLLQWIKRNTIQRTDDSRGERNERSVSRRCHN